MNKRQILLLIAIITVACKKPYTPGVINSPQSYLIVEGVINGGDTTTIKLSRTVNLSSKVTNNPVDGSVNVESDGGDSFALSEFAPGIYKAAGIVLNSAHKYRVHITTLDNNHEYASDYIPVKNAPPIDSVGFNVTAKGIQLYVNSHDVANSTKYYRFDYVETWKFHAKYASQWKSNGVDDVAIRPVSEQIYTCFQSDASSTIILGSTAKLTQDLLYQLPVTDIESTSEKIEDKYSILVRQYALSPDAYKFWENLKKNTEQLGSIFDAEPTQLAGNIHNVKDNTDIVIGYISVGSVATKRIFISTEQLPVSFFPHYPFDCELDSAWYSHPKTGYNDVRGFLATGIEIPVSSFGRGPKPDGYTASSRECTDCTIRGTTKQPDFWK